MDPVTILSTIGTCMTVAKVTISGLQSLCALKKKYENVDISVDSMVFKIQSISFSLSLLENWAVHGGGKHADAELVQQLEASIKSCVTVISGINKEVSSGVSSIKEKVIFLWKEDTVKDFDKGLDSQILAIQFLLTTTQFTNSATQRQKIHDPEARTIFNKARDAASIYDMDALTINEGPEDDDFTFDNVLLNSAAYRNVWKKQAMQNVAGESQSTLPSPSNFAPSKPSSQEHFRKPSTNTTISDQAFHGAASELTRKNGPGKQNNRWSFIPLAQTLRQKKLYGKLCTAADQGDLPLVRDLVEAGAIVKGSSCLIHAIDSDSVEMVEYLLSKGANPDAFETTTNVPCLHYTLKSPKFNLAIFLALLRSGARDPGMEDDKKRKGAATTILHGLVPCIQNLPDIAAVVDPLLELDTQCLLRLGVRLLFMKGRDPSDGTDTTLYTPLELAYFHLDHENVEQVRRLTVLISSLFANGVRLDKHAQGLGTIGISGIFGHVSAVDAHCEVIELLLKNGAHPDVRKDTAEMTFLSEACALGEVKLAKMLISYGADINAKDDVGRPLHHAVLSQNVEMVSLLLGAGADHEKTMGEDTATPLHLACAVENVDAIKVVQCLVSGGANIEARDARASTPLSVAVIHEHKKVVSYLLESGADVNTRSTSGTTPLLWAARGKKTHEDIARILMEKGADLTATDDNGHTAMHLASVNMAVDVLRVLLAQGGDPETRSKRSFTPLQLLERSANSDSVKRSQVIQLLTNAPYPPSVVTALPPGWERRTTDKDRPYYVNHNRMETSWEFPLSETTSLPSGWEKRLTKDGRSYYVNHNSKQTSWEPPIP